MMTEVTPEEFEKHMEDIYDTYYTDPEVCHTLMDEFMADTLKSLGYNKGIEIFDESVKWYS